MVSDIVHPVFDAEQYKDCAIFKTCSKMQKINNIKFLAQLWLRPIQQSLNNNL